MILCGRLDELPKSVNEIYRMTPHGIRKTDEGKAFENRCHDVVCQLLSKRRFRALPAKVGWQLDVIVWLPRLETAEWLKKGGDHDRFTQKDVDNFLKLALDGVFRALGENDSSNVDTHLAKKNGWGEGWVDFVLKEVSVPAEEPNNTELAQAINERNDGLRASSGDPSGLLQALHARANTGDDFRFTTFDAWRLEIMTQIAKIYKDVQARIACAARTGDINACFNCSDMMVINCILSNPKAMDEDGKVVGLFDLCQQKSGRYVGDVDRPEGGSMEATATKTTLSSQLTEILSLLGKADKEPKLLGAAVKAIYTLLTGLSDKNSATAQEVCVKLAMVLEDLIEAGGGKALPHSILYYKDINANTLSDSLKKQLAKSGSAYQLCVTLYGKYREAFVAWAETVGSKTKKAKGNGEAEAAAEPEETKEAGEEADGEEVEEDAAKADVEEAGATQEAAEAEAESEVVEEAKAQDETPEPVQDASVDAPAADMPEVHDIPADKPAKKGKKGGPKVEAAPEKEQLQIPGTEGDGKPADLAMQLAMLEKAVNVQTAKIEDQAAKMKAIADAFNKLREWLIQKG